MRKNWLTIAGLALAAIVLGTAGCVAPAPGASNFNLIFRYGVGAKNELNTFDGTYTRDMVMDPSITIPLSLTKEERDRIYQKMVEIGFFDYPDNFVISLPVGEPTTIVTPYSSYYFRVEYDSKVKELRWEAGVITKSAQEDKLRELIKLITDIIESKAEYKKLPAPTGGYD